MRVSIFLISVALSLACSGSANNAKPNVNSNANTKPATAALPIYGYEVVKAYPHDPKAFTEALYAKRFPLRKHRRGRENHRCEKWSWKQAK